MTIRVDVCVPGFIFFLYKFAVAQLYTEFFVCTYFQEDCVARFKELAELVSRKKKAEFQNKLS